MDLQLKKQYMIFEITKSNTKDGRPFLRMVMSDNSGALLNSIMFDCNKLSFEPKKGDMVNVSAVLQQYNNQSQLKVSDMEYISSGGAEAFLPKCSRDPRQMEEELKLVLDKHLSNQWVTELVKTFIKDEDIYKKFLMMPAAKSVHHVYIHGLLEHTLSVVKLAVKVSGLYPEINKDVLIAGALFHDTGKVLELDTSSGFEYTDNGRLLGHLMLGYSLVQKYADSIEGFPESLKQQLLHMIASHHGLLEYGSPQVPKTAEAFVLHYIDDMDAKLNNIVTILDKESVQTGGWSSYDRLLERQIYKPRED